MQIDEWTIQALRPADKGWVLEWIAELWHSPQIVAHDRLYQPHQLPGFVSRRETENVGLITYSIENGACEIVTLNSLQPRHGVGTALIAAVEKAAVQAGCKRLWLVTTNDNLDALAFYQKRGFRIARIDHGAVDRARRMKPEIPLAGEKGIPLHDEFEMEKSIS